MSNQSNSWPVRCQLAIRGVGNFRKLQRPFFGPKLFSMDNAKLRGRGQEVYQSVHRGPAAPMTTSLPRNTPFRGLSSGAVAEGTGERGLFCMTKKLSIDTPRYYCYTTKQIKGLSQKKRHDSDDSDGDTVI